jgi:topoisomerase IV subunit A
VLGRLLAYVKIDEIIKLIRASDDQADAKANLQAKYKFSERQAQDIVDLRLGQLTKLDGVKLNDERKGLEEDRKALKSILGDEKELKKLVISELIQDSKKYGDERRTLIKTADRAQVERTVVEEPVTVVLSKKGWIRARTGHALDLSTLTFKEGDELLQTLECKTTDPVIVRRPARPSPSMRRRFPPAAATARRSTRWSTRSPTPSSGWDPATSRASSS